MAAHITPQKVADAFVEQYYLILKKSPENVHRFYKDSSLLGWQGPDGLLTPVTTLSGINEKIMSSDYKNCCVEILTVDCQESLEGGVIVAVSGLSTWKDNVKRNFNQTFFLAKQEKGFFVLNDILRFFNEHESITSYVANEDGKQDQAVSSEPNSVATTVSESHAVNNEAVAKNEDVKEKLDLSVVKDTDSKVNTSKPSSPSHDKAPLVVKPASVAKVEAPKISYASVVAKVSPLTSPKAVKISSNVDKRVIAPSITKALSTPSNVAPKASTPSNVALKSPVSSNVAPKSSISGYGAPNSNSEARVIYVGGLPYDVTKQGVADVMKKFGPVRRSSDSIQIRRHEDGFCCGFVEFESADAARRAVQVHYVQFGDKEAYITYKRSSNRGNDGRGRSPTRGAFRNDNSKKGYENGEVGNKQRSQSGNHTTGNNNGQIRERPRQNRSTDQWRREEW